MFPVKPSSSAEPFTDGKLTRSMSSSVILRNEMSVYWARFALRQCHRIVPIVQRNAKWTYQRYTPTLSTCAVAKKSLVGENDTLVAILAVRKASIRRPEGISNVRIIESSDVVMSHRESEENVYARCYRDWGNGSSIGEPTRSKTRPLNPPNSRTILRVSISTRRTTRSSHVTARRPLSR